LLLRESLRVLSIQFGSAVFERFGSWHHHEGEQ